MLINFQFRRFNLAMLVFSIFLFGVTPSLVSAATPPASFQRGITAFAKKDYQTALKEFRTAEKAGFRTTQLYYNLGVTSYHLKNYPESERYFLLVEKNARMQQIARYNLGLVAWRTGDLNEAIGWFEKATAQGKDKKIRALSEHMLARLKQAQQAKQSRHRSLDAGASLAVGYDDNVFLRAADIASTQSDNYLDAFAWFDVALNRNWGVNGDVSVLDYQDIDLADYDEISGGVTYQTRTQNWRLKPELKVTQSTLGSNDYQRVTDIRFTGHRPLADQATLTLRYRYSDINSLNAFYDYLEGWRQRFRVDYHKRVSAGWLRLRYQLEFNDRQDLPNISYSPTRNSFRVRLRTPWKNNWETEAALRYRNSDYPSKGGVSRNDDRWRVRLVGLKRLSKMLEAGVRYTYTDNDSNVAIRTYERNDIQAFVDLRF